MSEFPTVGSPATDSPGTVSPSPSEACVGDLRKRYGRLDGIELLRVVIEQEFPARIALVSAFGAESAVLLDLVAQVDPATPVIFLETGKLFAETPSYGRALAARLGLTDVRTVRPDPRALAQHDPDGSLWRSRPDACCHLRKVVPLERALAGFDAWITGRKRYHGDVRRDLETIETADGRIKVNPLARWTPERIEAAMTARNLPRHPLVAERYLSIGCQPCTRKAAPGEAVRAGRWAGLEKTECGIHRSESAPG